MVDATKIKAGDGLYAHALQGYGVVDTVTDEGNFVRIKWDRVKRPDILSRSSPLWYFMEQRTL